ncbi:MAG: PqiC family protein [Opitutales bacterium]|jgi:uncharacterized lipoprotein YmbA
MNDRHFALLLPVLLLASCASPVPMRDGARHFLPYADAPKTEVALDNSPSLGIREVRLPAYLDGTKIALRKNGAELIYNDFELWAEPLDDSVRRILEQGLSARAGTDKVFLYPFKPNEARDVDLQVIFDRFEGDVDGGVHAQGRVMFSGAAAPAVMPFDYEASWDGKDCATLAKALGETVDRLAADIMRTLDKAD